MKAIRLICWKNFMGWQEGENQEIAAGVADKETGQRRLISSWVGALSGQSRDAHDQAFGDPMRLKDIKDRLEILDFTIQQEIDLFFFFCNTCDRIW